MALDAGLVRPRRSVSPGPRFETPDAEPNSLPIREIPSCSFRYQIHQIVVLESDGGSAPYWTRRTEMANYTLACNVTGVIILKPSANASHLSIESVDIFASPVGPLEG